MTDADIYNANMLANRPSWKQTFFDIAEVMAKRSPDLQTAVGAVITDKDNVIVGMGYNGLPRGCNPVDYPLTRPEKYDYFVHAEANAILNRNANLNGCIMYSTLLPCQECAKLIIQSGIKKVYYKTYREYPATIKMFQSAGIELSQ